MLWCDWKEPCCCCCCWLLFFLAHIPISVQTFKTAGAQLVGRLSVHPSEFNPRPPHFPTPPPRPSSQFHQRTVQLSWRKWGKIGLSDRASCYANMPSSLPSWGEHTHTGMQAKHRLQQTMGLILKAFHFSPFASLWWEKQVLLNETPELW